MSEQLDLLALAPKKKPKAQRKKAKPKRATTRAKKADASTPEPAPDESGRWIERKRKGDAKSWELVEGDLVVAVIREQGPKQFEWITKFAHSHATSLEQAKEFVKAEIDR